VRKATVAPALRALAAWPGPRRRRGEGPGATGVLAAAKNFPPPGRAATSAITTDAPARSVAAGFR
jgi:hypothetical protein